MMVHWQCLIEYWDMASSDFLIYGCSLILPDHDARYLFDMGSSSFVTSLQYLTTRYRQVYAAPKSRLPLVTFTKSMSFRKSAQLYEIHHTGLLNNSCTGSTWYHLATCPLIAVM